MAESLGFGVLCMHFPERERFSWVLTAKIHDAGIPDRLLLESELRSQLAEAGFTQADIDTGIQIARAWATTITTTSN